MSGSRSRSGRASSSVERDSAIKVAGEAANAVQACEQAAALDPDVIVMDIALPGVSGIEAMRRILARRPGLTAREFEVLRLLVRGETVKRIGQKLGLSEKTVANHQSVIREKLGARNGVQLARVATELGLSFWELRARVNSAAFGRDDCNFATLRWITCSIAEDNRRGYPQPTTGLQQ
jgi:DNA-binding NarL/FixJ family response regulator